MAVFGTHGRSFEIAEPLDIGDLDSVGAEIAGWRVEDTWGEDEYLASYMPYASAWAIIEQSIARFRDGQLPYEPAYRPRP